MKNLLILLVAVCLAGCAGISSYDKPFVIIYKSPGSSMCWDDACRYAVNTANGRRLEFCDAKDLYMIGDTIK